jgi:DNA-binding GntR family transcriptional regulator
MPKIRKIHKSKSTTQKTYRQLERAISQNDLIPGQSLVITELAADLGVSRTPVREALLMLEQAGLVEVDNGRMIVSGLSLADLEEVFEFRQAIELFAVDKVIERCSDKQLQTFKRTLEPFHHLNTDTNNDTNDDTDNTDTNNTNNTNNTDTNIEAAAKADLAFHRTLVLHADNMRMLASWDQMAVQLQRFWQDGRNNIERVQRDISECLQIANHIEARDGAAASALLRAHLQQTKLSLTHWRNLRKTA